MKDYDEQNGNVQNVVTCFPDLQQNAEGTITFKLVPAENQRPSRENRVRVRALFDFSAIHDRYIPCKEAGLDFQRGDILHIVSQDDPYW